jgi:2-oxoisovalerate dehydrogenase E2 component (dihydrolipoyl transacylase)
VEEGKVAKVGEGLCLIEVEEEDGAELEESAANKSEHPESSAPTEPTLTPSPREVEPSRVLHPLDPSTAASRGSDVEILSTPSVRHFAKQSRVNLADVAPGSGPRGRIERQDIEAFLARSKTESATSEALQLAQSTSMTERNDIVVPLNRTRHAMWKAMTKVRLHSVLRTSLIGLQSLEIPHFGYDHPHYHSYLVSNTL